MTRAKKLLFLYQQQHITPNHIELSYLQSSGTQYIDTGIIGSSELKIEIKVMFTTTNNTTYLIGSRNSTNGDAFLLLTNNALLRTDYGTGVNGYIPGLTLTTTDIYTITKDLNLTYVDGVLKSTLTKSSFNSGLSMYLFSTNTNGAASAQVRAKIYYCKIWDAHGTLLRDFIPVINENVYCMYDKVSDSYFINKGTGAFTGGM